MDGLANRRTTFFFSKVNHNTGEIVYLASDRLEDLSDFLPGSPVGKLHRYTADNIFGLLRVGIGANAGIERLYTADIDNTRLDFTHQLILFA